MSETRPKYTKEWLNENLPYIQITKDNQQQVCEILNKMGFTEVETDYKPNFISISAPNEYCFWGKTSHAYDTIPAADFIADNIHLLQPEQPVLTPCPDDWEPEEGYSISEYEAVCIDDSSSSQFFKCGEKQEFTGCFDKRFEINIFCSFYKKRFATPTLKSGAVKKVDQHTFEKFANPELGEPIAQASTVHQPNHYMKGGIEVGKFISAKGLNFNRGQAIKYICRAGLKDQNKTIEDLQKAIRSLQMEVEFLTELNDLL